MDRRRFVAGTLTLWAAPLAAETQDHKPGKVPRVGLLTDESVSLAWAALPVEAFSKGPRDLGWVEGQNVTLERRYAEDNTRRCQDSPPNWSA